LRFGEVVGTGNKLETQVADQQFVDDKNASERTEK
jgi:hypothetical protein